MTSGRYGPVPPLSSFPDAPTGDRGTGADRRVADLSKSASGNRARELAEVLSVLAETLRMRRDQSADFASSEYGAGFADGMSQAYEAAADMLRHHARAEDVR